MKNPFRTAAGFLVGASLSFCMTAFTPALAAGTAPEMPQQQADACTEDEVRGTCCPCGDGLKCCVKIGPIQSDN